MGNTLTLVDYMTHHCADEEWRQVRGRPIGKYLAVRRLTPTADDQHTAFSVDHIQTGRRLVGFSSEETALRCASDIDQRLGEALDFTDPELALERIPEDFRLLVTLAGDDDEWCDSGEE